MAAYPCMIKSASGALLCVLTFCPAYADDGYHPYYLTTRDAISQTNIPPALENGRPVYEAPASVPVQPAAWEEPVAPPAAIAAPVAAAPAADPAPVPAEETSGVDLGTRGGFQLGVEASNYHYQEHTDSADHQFMRQNGIKAGLVASATETFSYGMFLSGEFRFAYSKNSYFSDPTGRIDRDADDYLGEGRLLFGKDFVVSGEYVPAYDFTPYTGLGLRDLFNNSNGVVVNNSAGYRRNSEYLYLPVGLTQRFPVSNDARLSVNAEYDQLLQGMQSSYSNDATFNEPNVINNQRHGFGLRGSIMYEGKNWSFGPFGEYWNINASDYSIYNGSDCAPYYCALSEPHNQTWEYGAELRYRFK
ncbi:MAG: hypothetical protein P4M15_13175 [Alphaproteobacteria bacterium]|nr:hypothetical protein [Alphaproteobacteria bacterium]